MYDFSARRFGEVKDLAHRVLYHRENARKAKRESQARARWKGMLDVFEYEIMWQHVQLYDAEKVKVRELLQNGIPEDFNGVSYETHLWDIVMPCISDFDDDLGYSVAKDTSGLPEGDIFFIRDTLKALSRRGVPLANRKIVWPHVMGAFDKMQDPVNDGLFGRLRQATLPVSDRSVIDRDLARTFPRNCF